MVEGGANTTVDVVVEEDAIETLHEGDGCVPGGDEGVCAIEEGLECIGTPTTCVADDVGGRARPTSLEALPADAVFDVLVGDEDCFSFVLAEAVVVDASTDDGAGGCPGDTVLRAYPDGDFSFPYHTDDDSGIDHPGIGACSHLVAGFSAGSWTLCVAAYSSANLDDVALHVASITFD